MSNPNRGAMKNGHPIARAEYIAAKDRAAKQKVVLVPKQEKTRKVGKAKKVKAGK